jgi:thymidine phosphorylase
MGRRAVAIVLDGLGAGNAPDDAEFGDEGANTLANTARAVGGLEDLPVSSTVREVEAPRGSYVARFGAQGVGRAALTLGAGRQRKGNRIDPGSGVEVLAKPGDRIEEGTPIAHLYGEGGAERAEALVLEALEISDEPVEPPPAILDNL